MRAYPIIVDNIASDEEFTKLAESYGDKRSKINIQNLTVKKSTESNHHSLSGKYGIGFFPHHTDEAWLRTPPKYILLRFVSGDYSRNTYFKRFSDILKEFSRDELAEAIWSCNTGSQSFYTTLRFHSNYESGYRFDLNIFRPANSKAKVIHNHLVKECNYLGEEFIKWKPNRVAIFDNWNFLHARGSTKSKEVDRILQRISL